MVVLHTGAAGRRAGRGVDPAARRCRPRWPGRCSRSSSRPRRCAGGASPPSAARWNTRVIVVPGLAPVTGGPYRLPAATPTTSPSSSRGSRCRWCTPPGSPRWSSPSLNAALLAVRIRVENAALATLPRPTRPPSPGRRPPVHDLVVAGGGPVGLATALYAPRAGPRRRRARAPHRPDRQGVRRGSDARCRRRARRPRRRPARSRADRDPLPRRPADGPGATARFRPRRPAAACAGPCCTTRWPTRRRRRRHRRRPPPAVARVDDRRRPPARRRRARPAPRRRRRPALAGAPPASASTCPPAGRRRFGLRCHVAAGAVDVVRRGALVAARRGLRDPGRPTTSSGSPSSTAGSRFEELIAELPAAARAARRRTAHAGDGRGTAAAARDARASPGGSCSSATPAGYVDALTGEGIALGLAQARAAVAAIAAGAPSATSGWPAGWAPRTSCSRTPSCGPRRPAVRRRPRPGRRPAAVGLRRRRQPARQTRSEPAT